MFKTIFFAWTALVLGCFVAPLSAQQAITNAQKGYTQDFNGLPSTNGTNNSRRWVDNQTLLNWYAARADSAGVSSFPMRATDGSYGGPHLCSFRLGNTNTTPQVPVSGNRALGAIAAANASGTKVHFAWGVRFKNTGDSVLRRVTVTYALEQWRKSDATNEQPLRFSYKVSAAPITGMTADETGYAKVPFLNAVSPIYTAGAATALNGDQAANRVLVTHRFNVTVNPNEEIMLKWFDADDAQVDHGLAIDDLNVQFSTTAGAFDHYTGSVPFEHFMKSVILDIPDEGSGVVYVAPTPAQRGSWQTAMGQLLQGQYAAAATTLNTNGLDYRLTQFSAGSNTYYVVSKDGASGNYWGTYVFNPNATRNCVSFQAPHPIHDAMTGEQATYLFQHLDAHSLMVAGTHRCLSDSLSGCAGTTDACGNDVPYRLSDMAHTVESVFQTTTEALAANLASRRFIQLHGFGMDSGDPHFIISNGTRQTPNRDFVEQLGEALEDAGNWTYEAPHLNTSYNKLIATTNTQGRFLNNYNQGDICTGTSVSTAVSSRFLHIEQFNAMRTDRNNYDILSDALESTDICNCALAANKPVKTAGQAATLAGQVMEIRSAAQDLSAAVCYLETELPEVSLVVFNLMGQPVFQQQIAVSGNALVALPTESWPAGAYVATATFGSQRMAVRFMVQR